MHQRLLRSVQASLLALVVTGCGRSDEALLAAAQEQWPRQDPAGMQRLAIEQAETALRDLGGPDVYLSVDLASLTQAIEAQLASSGESVESVEVQADNQQLVTRVTFDRNFEALDMAVKGEAQISASPALEGFAVRLAPRLSELELTRVSSSRSSDEAPQAAAKALNDALAGFLEELQGGVAQVSATLDYRELFELDPREWLSEMVNAREIAGEQVALATSIAGSAILLDRAGVHVLADFDVERLALPPTVARVLPPEDLTDRFVSLASEFRDRVERAFGPIDDAFWAGTSAAVTTEFLANSANLILSPISVCATLDVTGAEFPIDEVIGLGAAANLNCGKGYDDVNCKRRPRGCELDKSCDPDLKCTKCKWYDVDCHANKLTCEASKAAYKPTCAMEKVQFKVQCEAEYRAQRAQCELERAAKKAGCRDNQAWLSRWGQANIGRATGKVAVTGTPMRVCIAGGLVSQDWMALTLEGTAQGRTRVDAYVDFQPQALGELVCKAQWQGAVTAEVDVISPQVTLAARLVGTERDDRHTKLIYQLANSQVLAKTSPGLGEVMSEQSGLAVACKPAVTLASITAAISKELRVGLFRDEFALGLGATNLAVPIADLMLSVNGSTLALQAEHSAKSIRFRSAGGDSG